MEPRLPPFPARLPERELGMPPHSGIYPGGRVAEALAAILPPPASAAADLTRPQIALAPLGRPAELATDSRSALAPHYFFERPTQRVARPQPHKMKQLVDENARELGGCAVERDTPFAQERSRMRRAVPVAQAGDSL